MRGGWNRRRGGGRGRGGRRSRWSMPLEREDSVGKPALSPQEFAWLSQKYLHSEPYTFGQGGDSGVSDTTSPSRKKLVCQHAPGRWEHARPSSQVEYTEAAQWKRVA
ncbi:unnamed protein product [Prorocentrum cordatum]|uniref:Uncharacterized protein n=1 Tax=Prorocentrum cordatum TaxID=2364126 RepID=A0ABN9Q593_9DINO|nr:unnamed protein product [Polarella glacialis]